MTKRKKIIVIGVAVTLALVIGLGGFVHAISFEPYFDHADVGGNKLLGVGEMGHYYYGETYWDQYQEWDTQFIITNPNCDRDLTIEWVALIASDDACGWPAEEVIFEGTPEDWYSYFDIEIPGNEFSVRGVLSPHEAWQVSIAELIGGVVGWYPNGIIDDCDLGKYTVEVTWSGAYYTGWWWWGYWRSGRPLTGWQKGKCWSYFDWSVEGITGEYLLDFAISEAPMELFHSRQLFSPPDWWHLE